ncbi:MAG TPA: PIN domain-containing protein [Methanosarcinaceae archaeon]|nr:PIN domain-containing protein [Methanosarcinaceae archaeon]
MIVIDSCVWIHAFLKTDDNCISLLKKVLDGDIKPIVSAYIAKEISDNIVFEGRKSGKNVDLMQTAIWSLFREPYIKTTFTPLDYDNVVLREVKGRAENNALAKALRIEPKDAPIVALAYHYSVPLVTMDVKSLLNIKERISELIDVDIFTVDEMLDIL